MRLLCLALSLLLAACSKPDRWLGIVYPEKGNLLHHRVIGEYPSLNECLTAVNAQAEIYECGLNCESRAGLMICKETVGNER